MPGTGGGARSLSSLPAELLVNLTLRELRGKFKRTALGWGWSVLNPVLNLIVYATVFGAFLKLQPPVGDPSGLFNYPFFLVCGLLPWTFLSMSLSTSSTAYAANESLVKKVYFPRSVLPAAAVLATLVTFLVEMGVLSTVLVGAGNMVLPWLPVALAVVALQAAFALGLGLVVAALNARFRDVSHLLSIGLNVWMYATPILYPISLVPERASVLGIRIPAADLLRYNPMYHFVAAYRDLLYHLRAPTLGTWLVMAGAAVVAVGLGVVVHRRYEPILAEVL